MIYMPKEISPASNKSLRSHLCFQEYSKHIGVGHSRCHLQKMFLVYLDNTVLDLI